MNGVNVIGASTTALFLRFLPLPPPISIVPFVGAFCWILKDFTWANVWMSLSMYSNIFDRSKPMNFCRTLKVPILLGQILYICLLPCRHTAILGHKAVRVVPWKVGQIPSYSWLLSVHSVKLCLFNLLFCIGMAPVSGQSFCGASQKGQSFSAQNRQNHRLKKIIKIIIKLN
jgi:hypothetical protein